MSKIDALAEVLEKLRLHPNVIRHILQQLEQNGQVDLVVTHLPLGEYEIRSQDGQKLAITIILKNPAP